MRLIDADALKEDFECVGFNDYDDFNRALWIIDNAPTVKPCVNCDLYFIAKTKEEMRKGGAE